LKPNILCILLLFLISTIFAQTPNIINANNEYQGETYFIDYSDSNSPDQMLISKTVFLNFEKNARKIIYKTTDSYSKERGIIQQTEFFGENEIREKYDIYFSDDYIELYAISRTVEYVDTDDNIFRTEWYQNEEIVDITTDNDYNTRFPFYKLSLIKKMMLEDDYIPSDKFDFGASVRYIRGRSIIQFSGELIDLNELDRKYLLLHGNSLSNPQLNSYYDKKITVIEDGEEYILFIQKTLEQYVHDGNRAKIDYYIGTYNNNLILSTTGFRDL